MTLQTTWLISIAACWIAVGINVACIVQLRRASRRYDRAVHALTFCAVRSFVVGHRGTFQAWAALLGNRMRVRIETASEVDDAE